MPERHIPCLTTVRCATRLQRGTVDDGIIHWTAKSHPDGDVINDRSIANSARVEIAVSNRTPVTWTLARIMLGKCP